MYYVTICTYNREKILSKIITDIPLNNTFKPITYLTNIGIEIKNSILNIQLKNTNIYIKEYVIMPDHIHMIININNDYGIQKFYPKKYGFENIDICNNSANKQHKERRGRRSLQGLIKDFKSVTTRKYGKKLWQKSYYEHIIRNEKEYYQICNYIQQNPLRYVLKNRNQ